MSQIQAAQVFGVSLRAANKWMALDKSGGLRALKAKRRGRRAGEGRLDRAQSMRIRQMIIDALPMADVLVPWLEPRTDRYLFNYGGKPYTKAGFDAIMKRLFKRSGVKPASLYTIRHAVATELYTRSVSHPDVKMFLGHRFESFDPVTVGFPG